MTHPVLRLLKHRRLDEGDVVRLLGIGALQRAQQRVAASETGHSGEIRVCVEAGLPWSYLRRRATPRERAVAMFGKLRVWDTEHNNGVLIYLLLADRDVEIVADRGVAAKIPAAEWEAICREMEKHLRAGSYGDAAVAGIRATSDLLARHFPLRGPRHGEQPDEPVVL